jgi:deazaflavin-dependent oxidoreductase (nitroreductase family)
MYVDGRYAPERKHNPLIRTHSGGRILSAVQLPWFRALPPAGFGVLTTTGRKTGKHRHRCIRAIRRQNKAYIVAIGGAHSHWAKNIQANPDVRLRIRDGTFSGIARELRDPGERSEAMAAFCGTVNRFDYAECRVHRPGRPTRATIEQLHRAWFEGGTPFVIELADQI